MLHKTRGIVLKVTDYSENSVVAKIYTAKFGLQSYLINGVKKPKAKIRMNMLQPLHLLDLVVYHKPNGNIQRISDARTEPVLQSIPYHISKSAIVMFMNEMIYKSLKQQHEDEVMFHFIEKSIELLDESEKGFVNFHLIFLIKLTRFLGFYPDLSDSQFKFFDLIAGNFVANQPPHIHFIEEKYIKFWLQLLSSSIDNFYTLQLGTETRKYLLQKIIDYYTLHIEDFGQVKSNLILEEVLS
ncbi:DNA repair protein RecO [Pedobacter psychrophilus]|uniref:DNA repair protein RecO n=1 Tax=Pedobacter psychrophilus TaxID=1826909 RepID=A0A179DHZ3_9SPHI|nr:DNA repair protein RecO [Pedobacter psychrophilus]OAQ40641.1 DNA repair protein RecO [Pedobacter psychrophilus]